MMILKMERKKTAVQGGAGKREGHACRKEKRRKGREISMEKEAVWGLSCSSVAELLPSPGFES
jgi:hypothetical protein